MPMVSVIITSFKEPDTIGKSIRCIADTSYSGLDHNFEILQISPDEATLEAGAKVAAELNLSKKQYRQLVDPHKGKPTALNMAFKAAKGDIIILTDGDTFFEENAAKLLIEPFEDNSIYISCGKAMVEAVDDTFWDYAGKVLCHAANHKRKSVFNNFNGKYYKSTDEIFPASGYIYAIRNIKLKLPKDLSIDDAYISKKIQELGHKGAYTDKAICYTKYPQNYSDYIKQKRRNIVGHRELNKYFKKENLVSKERTFLGEIKYIKYPLRFADNFKEKFLFTPLFYLLRLALWTDSLIHTYFKIGTMKEHGWDRIESSK